MPTAPVPLPNRLESPRLVLASLQFTDAADLNAAVRESLAELSLWYPWATPAHTIRETQNRIQQALAGQRESTETVYTVRSKAGRIVGEARLGVMNDPMGHTVPAYEINIWIRTSENRKGYGAEAVKLMADYAMLTLGAQRISAKCSSLNAACIRMMEKAAMPREAVLKNTRRMADDTLAHTFIFARTT